MVRYVHAGRRKGEACAARTFLWNLALLLSLCSAGREQRRPFGFNEIYRLARGVADSVMEPALEARAYYDPMEIEGIVGGLPYTFEDLARGVAHALVDPNEEAFPKVIKERLLGSTWQQMAAVDEQRLGLAERWRFSFAHSGHRDLLCMITNGHGAAAVSDSIRLSPVYDHDGFIYFGGRGSASFSRSRGASAWYAFSLQRLWRLEDLIGSAVVDNATVRMFHGTASLNTAAPFQ